MSLTVLILPANPLRFISWKIFHKRFCIWSKIDPYKKFWKFLTDLSRKFRLNLFLWVPNIFTSTKSIKVSLNCLEKALIRTHYLKSLWEEKTTKCSKESLNLWKCSIPNKKNHKRWLFKKTNGKTPNKLISLKSLQKLQILKKKSKIGKPIELAPKMSFSRFHSMKEKSFWNLRILKVLSLVKSLSDSTVQIIQKRTTFILRICSCLEVKMKKIWSKYASLNIYKINTSKALATEFMEWISTHYLSENVLLQFRQYKSESQNPSWLQSVMFSRIHKKLKKMHFIQFLFCLWWVIKTNLSHNQHTTKFIGHCFHFWVKKSMVQLWKK